MTTTITPRLGLPVLYTLSESDVREIRQKRVAAGSATKSGNDAHEGDTYPGIIVRDWAQQNLLDLAAKGELHRGDGVALEPDDYLAQASVNLQVFLDGNDVHWATSRSEQTGEDPKGHFVLA